MGGTILLFYLGSQIVDFENNSNAFLGIGARGWFMFSMTVLLLHQAYVWLCWRSELCWKTISNTIGFKGYAIGFLVVGLLRFSCIGLCFAIISGSKAMFVFAVYSYISIWLHYFATEKEDFKIVYGK